MFDQTDVDKVKYLLSKGIDYERAKKLVTEQKAISASTNLAWNTANQIIDTPAPAPVAPTVAPVQPVAQPQYNINPTPAQAKSVYPLQTPNAQQQIDNTWSQFDTTKVGRTIKWAKDAIWGSLDAGIDALWKWVKWFVEKPANIVKTALYPIAPGAWKIIDSLMPQTTSKTNTQQDILNVTEWVTNIAFAPFAGIMWGIDANKSKMSTSTEDLGRINQNIWNFVAKVPGISNFRDQLPAQDQERFDSLLWMRSTIALTEWVRSFNKFKAEYQANKGTTNGKSPTSYVDADGNVVDYWPPVWSKALPAPEPVAKPPSYGPKESEVNKLLTKAVAQNVGWLKDAGKVKKSLDNLKGWITTIVQLKNSIQSLPKDEAGNIDYKFIDEAEQSAQTIISQSISEAKQQLRSDVETAIQTAWTEQIRPDPTPLLTMLNEQTKGFIDSQWQIIPGTESAYREYQNIINYLSDWQKTVADLQKLSTQLNRDAKQLYTGNPTPTSVIAEAVNYHLRQLLDETIENQLWVLGFGELKAKRGQLKNIEPAITKRWQVIDRQKPVWLFDFLGNFGAIDWVIDVIAGNPILWVVKAWGMKLLKMYVKSRNDQSKMLIKAMKILDEANEGREHSFNMNTPQFQAKKAQRNAEIARKEAEAQRKRAETYLQAQRNRQPEAIWMKTTTVTPEWVSKQSTVVKPANTTKWKISVRETGMIWVRRKPQEVFQLRADVNQTIKNTEKWIIGWVKKALPDDKAFNRILELDTDPNYEKVTPSEVLHPKSEQYETQYGPISSVAFDRTIQKVVVNWKSYNRWDVTIFRKLSDKEIENNQNINKFGELRQKLQDIKSGKENKISWPQLAWIMEDLGIEKIADIPDESLQTVLDMARARVNKPSGILWMKKAEPKEVSKEMPPAQPREHQDYVWEAKTVFLSNEQPAYIKAGITPSEIINWWFIKKAEQFADKVMRWNNDIVSKKRIVELIQREASEYKTKQLKYVNSELQKEWSNILNAKRDRVKELNNEFIKRHTDKWELKVDDSKPVVDSIEQQITEVVSEYPAINKYNPETKSAGNLILIQDKIKDIPGIKDFLKEKWVTDQQSFSDYIQSINRKIRPDINKQKQSDYDQARKDLFNMWMEQALQDAGVIKPWETPLQDIDNLLSKWALIDQAKEALKSYIDNAPVQEELAILDNTNWDQYNVDTNLSTNSDFMQWTTNNQTFLKSKDITNEDIGYVKKPMLQAQLDQLERLKKVEDRATFIERRTRDNKAYIERNWIDKFNELIDKEYQRKLDLYPDTVKRYISKWYDMPKEIINSNPEFLKAVDTRARYEKWLYTSFSNKDGRIDNSTVGQIWWWVKRQDWLQITPEQKQEIVKWVKDFGDAIWIDIKKLVESKDIVFSHLNGKNAFLSKGVWLYREWKNISISVWGKETASEKENWKMVTEQVSTTMQHELWHALDFMTKNRLLSNVDAGRNYNPVQSMRKYYRKPEEVTARLIEQYVSIKKWLVSYYDKPWYWKKDKFDTFIPKIEEAIQKYFPDYIISKSGSKRTVGLLGNNKSIDTGPTYSKDSNWKWLSDWKPIEEDSNLYRSLDRMYERKNKSQ